MSGARNKFLRAPTRNEIDDIPADARASLRRAEHALMELRDTNPSRDDLHRSIQAEAEASANIEDEFDPERIRLHAQSLQDFLNFPNGVHVDDCKIKARERSLTNSKPK